MLIVQFLLVVAYYYMLAVSSAFMVRVVLLWIMPDSDNVFVRVSQFMTEAFIIPFRKLFAKMNWFQGSMFDMAFLAGSLLVWFLTIVVMLIRESMMWY